MDKKKLHEVIVSLKRRNTLLKANVSSDYVSGWQDALTRLAEELDYNDSHGVPWLFGK